MSEAPPSEPVKIKRRELLIQAEPKSAKDKFFEAMEKRVKIVNGRSFRRKAEEQARGGYWSASIFEIPEGKRIKDAVIYINRDNFVLDNEDYTDLIPITVRHEITELWVHAKTGYSLAPPPMGMGRERGRETAHKLARREEYDYAFEIGKAERRLDFVKRLSQRFPEHARERIIKEHEEAFSKAKSRYERRR